MKKNGLIFKIGIFSLISFIVSCGLMFKDINCRVFSLTAEKYWFPAQVNDYIAFRKDSANVVQYQVVKKEIWHTTKYWTDTGCNCLNESGMLLIHGDDSLFFKRYGKSLSNSEPTEYEDVIVEFNGVQSSFTDYHRTHLSNFVIDNDTFVDVKKFERTTSSVQNIKTIYMAKDIGIIRFVLLNGEIWTNSNLNPIDTISTSSFDFSEGACE